MTTFTVTANFARETKEVSGINFASVEKFATKEAAAAALAAFPKGFGLKIQACSAGNENFFRLAKQNAFSAVSGNDANETGIKRVKKMLAAMEVEFVGGSLNSATREEVLAWLG